MTPKFEALIYKPGLVDIKSSSFRCQGKSKNGGRCRQRVDKDVVSRAVLGLHDVALDLLVVDEALGHVLSKMYRHLLCGTSGHNTPEQTRSCVEKKAPVVEEWREKWIAPSATPADTVVKQEEVECERCPMLQRAVDRAFAAKDGGMK